MGYDKIILFIVLQIMGSNLFHEAAQTKTGTILKIKGLPVWCTILSGIED